MYAWGVSCYYASFLSQFVFLPPSLLPSFPLSPQLNLSHNTIQLLEVQFLCLPSLQKLNLAHNAIKKIIDGKNVYDLHMNVRTYIRIYSRMEQTFLRPWKFFYLGWFSPSPLVYSIFFLYLHIYFFLCLLLFRIRSILLQTLISSSPSISIPRMFSDISNFDIGWSDWSKPLPLPPHAQVLETVTSLNLSHNRLHSLDGLSAFVSVTALNLNYNLVGSKKDLHRMMKLRQLNTLCLQGIKLLPQYKNVGYILKFRRVCVFLTGFIYISIF